MMKGRWVEKPTGKVVRLSDWRKWVEQERRDREFRDRLLNGPDGKGWVIR